MAEINCPFCNPEAKPKIRKLNRTSICLICMNNGWTSFDKKCSLCGNDSGIYLTCESCRNKATDTLPITTEKVWKIDNKLLT